MKSEAGVFTARGIGDLHAMVNNLAREGFRIVTVIDTQNGDYHVVAQKDATEAISDAAFAAGVEAAAKSTFYIDCEFDGHNGPILSMAMVRGDGFGLHAKVQQDAQDPWVIANVLPLMDMHSAEISRTVKPDDLGQTLRDFIGSCQRPTIIADSPVDVARFCRAISTGPNGGWASAGYRGMNFIVQNVDCYPTSLPGAVQHNAWWDAMALRAAIRALLPVKGETNEL